MIDPDGDIVRCSYAQFVEGGHLPEQPGIKVLNEVCQRCFIFQYPTNIDPSFRSEASSYIILCVYMQQIKYKNYK